MEENKKKELKEFIQKEAASLRGEAVLKLLYASTIENAASAAGFLQLTWGEDYFSNPDNYNVDYFGDSEELSTVLTMMLIDNDTLRDIVVEAVEVYKEYQKEDVPDFGVGEEEKGGQK